VQRGLLTPDTFRHHQQKGLRHMQLRDAGPRFAVAPAPRGWDRLHGTYFHLDNEHRGFFGHAVTEQVSRLWAWQRAKQLVPDLRVLMSVNRGREVAEWELVLLEAAGIDRCDVEVVRRPVRVERLLSASPMFSLPQYVHPRIVETWDAIGGALLDRAVPRERPQRLFVSRRHEKRACLNRLEVEGLFTSCGFQVVFPEEHPLPEQVALFHHADVIAGFAGSGLFTVMFTSRPKHLVTVVPDTYGPSNEYLIAAVRGHRLDEAVGTTPEALPPGVRRDKPLRWPFTVDIDAEGAWLRGILAETAG
jgi:capsular polysaccharide biosynthesis protein